MSPHHKKTGFSRIFAYAKTKAQISFAVTFAFDTRIVQSIYSKFQGYSHLLWLRSSYVSDLVGNPKDRFSHNEANSLICVGPGRKPQRPVFSQ